MEDIGINSRDFVNSLARGLDVLRTFSKDSRAMTLSEVASKANLSRAGARRLLLTLVELGYAAKDGRLFRLTPRYLALGQSSMSAIPLSEVADQCVRTLAKEFNGCVSLAIRDGDELVQVASASSADTVIATQKSGTRRVLYNTIAGRVFLALGNDADRIVVQGMPSPAPLANIAGTARAPVPLARPNGGSNGQALYREQMQQIRSNGFLISRPGESNSEVSVVVPVATAVTHEILAVLTASSWRPQSDHIIVSDWLPAMRSVSNRILEASLR